MSNIASGTISALDGSEEPKLSADIIAEVNFAPQSFNPKSQGRWISAHLFFPSGYNSNNLNIPTVKLNDNISADAGYKGANYFKKTETMKINKGNLPLIGFLQSLGVVVYCSLVAIFFLVF